MKKKINVLFVWIEKLIWLLYAIISFAENASKLSPKSTTVAPSAEDGTL